MFLGFQRFYLHGRAYPDRPLTPPIAHLVILHGAAMTGWMVVFLAQPLLILAGNRRLHMRVGRIAAVLAACIVLLGVKLAIEAARAKPPGMLTNGLTATQFMAIPILSMAMFGGLVGAAVWFRRRPSWHRSLMLLGTLAALSAAIARIDVLSGLYAGTFWDRVWGPFFFTAVVAVFLLILQCLLTRSLDRFFAWGCAGLAAALALAFQATTTPAWDTFAQFLLRTTA
jgi:hypothetical protein